MIIMTIIRYDLQDNICDENDDFKDNLCGENDDFEDDYCNDNDIEMPAALPMKR